jgi:hypothetical protein
MLSYHRKKHPCGAFLIPGVCIRKVYYPAIIRPVAIEAAFKSLEKKDNMALSK